MADEYVVINQAAMHELFESAAGPLAKTITKLAIRVERGAKQRAPVDTGRLRSSITWQLGHDAHGLVARVGSNVHYAPHQEFGTRRMRPLIRSARQCGRACTGAR